MNKHAHKVILNLINGNLTDALEGATYHALVTLIIEAQGMGYNYNEALLMGTYLKGSIPFQDYCDNMNNTNC
jgi:hypothetical protein